MKFDLGFGNSVCVRDAFMETVGGHYVFGYSNMMDMDYPAHEGDPELIKITRSIIKYQFKSEYKHVFITNGATGGVVIALRAYRQRGKHTCKVREAPYYSRYPGMLKAADMKMETRSNYNYPEQVILLDLPSNPLGLLTEIPGNWGNDASPIILDAVYYNGVYCPRREQRNKVRHDVLVGSYSKLFGINGIRLGWLATNDDLLANRIKELITAEYCGLSAPSAFLIKECWKRFQQYGWDFFEQLANNNLDANREEWSRIERFFGGYPTGNRGMFYYGPIDHKCKELLNKAGIWWTSGSLMGTDDNFGRFNLGQSNQVIDEAVSALLKVDTIR